jgi:hypothetical protein
MNKISFIILLISLISCSDMKDFNYVKSNTWSHHSGFSVGNGDFIIFDTTNIFYLKLDTIYYRNKPRAIIMDVNKSKFEMKVSSIDKKEIGVYINIKESLK